MDQQFIDHGIETASNELLQIQKDFAKQRAEHEFELMKLSRRQDQVNHQWEAKLKPTKAQVSTAAARGHQDAVAAVFGNDGSDGNDKSEPMSPFLLSRLSQLCFRIHLMTRAESFVDSIHQDYRVIVNWLHERWEKIERETAQITEKIKNIQAERKRLVEEHEERLLLLDKRKKTVCPNELKDESSSQASSDDDKTRDSVNEVTLENKDTCAESS